MLHYLHTYLCEEIDNRNCEITSIYTYIEYFGQIRTSKYYGIHCFLSIDNTRYNNTHIIISSLIRILFFIL